MTTAPLASAAGFEQLLDYRQQLLARLEAQPGEFAARVALIPAAEWGRRRDPQGRSVLAVAAHLRAVEAGLYLPRLRRMLAEDNPQFSPEEDAAAEISGPPEPLTAILAAWSQARAELVDLLRPLTPAGWSRTGFYPPVGRRTVQWWAERAYHHAREHQAFIGD
jgi:hypothetical protein